MPPRIRRSRQIHALPVRPVPVRREVKVKWYDYLCVCGVIIAALFVAKYLGLPRLNKIFTTYNDATYADFISFLVIVALPSALILLYFSSEKMKIMQEQVQKLLQGRRQWLRKFRIWSIQLSDIPDKLRQLPSVFVYLHKGAFYFFLIHLVLISSEGIFYLVTAVEKPTFFYNFAVEVIYYFIYVRGDYAFFKLFGHFSYFIMRVGRIFYSFFPEYVAIAFNCINFGCTLLVVHLLIVVVMYGEEVWAQNFGN